MNKKKIRAAFRDTVFARDNFRCLICGSTENIEAHHITNRNEMPNGGYVRGNGATLCPLHHQAAEMNEIKAGELYKLIGSSYEKAYVESQDSN